MLTFSSQGRSVRTHRHTHARLSLSPLSLCLEHYTSFDCVSFPASHTLKCLPTLLHLIVRAFAHRSPAAARRAVVFLCPCQNMLFRSWTSHFVVKIAICSRRPLSDLCLSAFNLLLVTAGNQETALCGVSSCLWSRITQVLLHQYTYILLYKTVR